MSRSPSAAPSGHAGDLEALLGTLRRALWDEGQPSPALSAMARLFASDAAMRVTTDAVQVLGGYGFLKEFGVERFMRDAKITQIYEGTNQVMRIVIARQLLGGPGGVEVGAR